MKKAFTLIELLVVIAIIGTLAGVLFAVFGNFGESARAAQCRANLGTLAKAVISYASMEGGDETEHFYPRAGSIEVHHTVANRSSGKGEKVFAERKGWISWGSKGCYDEHSQARSSQIGNCKQMSAYYTRGSNDEDGIYCLTNGVLWAGVSRNAACYRCPSHVKFCEKTSLEPRWSYVMNSYFGWQDSDRPKSWFNGGVKFNVGKGGSFDPSKVLLFAELPWESYTGVKPEISAADGTKNDCTLQYDGDERESIGFNHKKGKKIYAHVVFADASVSEYEWRTGVDTRELTEWLCKGKDVTMNGGSGKYEKND